MLTRHQRLRLLANTLRRSLGICCQPGAATAQPLACIAAAHPVSRTGKKTEQQPFVQLKLLIGKAAGCH
jgi:hypothetical protein